MRRLYAFVLLTALFSSLSSAQTSPADALRNIPKRITIAELPEGYRAVGLGSGDFGVSAIYGLIGMGRGAGNNDQSLLLFSLMGSTFVDPDEFAALLDGKRSRIRGFALDILSMLKTAPSGSDSENVPSPIFTETWIEAGRVVQWSPRPDITRESLLKVFGNGEPREAADQTRTLSNAKQVALGVMIYCSDSDDVFPFAESTPKAQEVTLPYLKNSTVWTTKNSNGGRLLYNTSLSGISATTIESPSQTLLIWDEKAWPDGRRCVAFADGHASYLNTAQWEEAWARELQRRRNARFPQRSIPISPPNPPRKG